MLLRHAKAEPGGSVPDELRPLALTGRRQCGDVGQRLVTSGLVPEQVLVSSAVRTRQTWELVQSAMGDVPAPEVEVSDALYDAGPRDVMAMLRAADDRVASILVVGHEPTMSTLAALLADPTPPRADLDQVALGLPTAGFAVLEVTAWSDVDRGAFRLLEVVRPHR